MLISQAEAQRIAVFVGRLKAIPEDKRRMTVLAELSWIHNRKKPDGEKYSAMVNRKVITAYRDAIREEFGDESKLLGWMRYSDARVDEYKEHQAAELEAKHRSQRPIDAEEFVNSALVLLGSAMRMRWSMAAAIAALCALTGRRPFEVAVTGHFRADPDYPHQLIFSGQAKTRDAARSAEEFPIPVLGDRELVLEAIEKVQSIIGDREMKNTVFSQRYAKEIGIQSKKVFEDGYGNPIKPSDLREAYSAVAFSEFAPRGISEVQYMNDILGHKTDMLTTTLYYIGFYVM
ncbi:protelomerase family protein [Nocardia tengchongensis]|uniref:protelomerase family protein n=1 Tax=Nocardia tengchongensis TaxID=2055889 RepID=UPI00368432D2